MELSFTARTRHEGNSKKIWLLCVAKRPISHPNSRSKKGRAIWLTGSARELLITSHVIELRSDAERPRRGCAMRDAKQAVIGKVRVVPMGDIAQMIAISERSGYPLAPTQGRRFSTSGQAPSGSNAI